LTSVANGATHSWRVIVGRRELEEFLALDASLRQQQDQEVRAWVHTRHLVQRLDLRVVEVVRQERLDPSVDQRGRWNVGEHLEGLQPGEVVDDGTQLAVARLALELAAGGRGQG
jgi:hypothetical protein